MPLQAAPVFGGPGGPTHPYQAALELLGLRPPAGEPSPSQPRPLSAPGASGKATSGSGAQQSAEQASRPDQKPGQVGFGKGFGSGSGSNSYGT